MPYWRAEFEGRSFCHFHRFTLHAFTNSSLPATEPPGWELGIEYPQEDEDNPFKLSSTGTVSVSFFVSNNELLPITVDFEYEIPLRANMTVRSLRQ